MLHLSALITPLALVASVMLGACGESASTSSFAGAPQEGDQPATSSSGGQAFGSDASVSTSPTRGSPLCAVVAGECTPDDDGTKPLAYGALACATAPVDASAPESNVGKGCRIAKSGSGPTGEPKCDVADRRGLDGASCEKGRDCAPGFDCVDGDKGPVCRRYCCSGSCGVHAAQNGGPTFCDVQKLVEPGLPAPVCMPLKTCKLLLEGQCGDKETCAIVTDKGDTGCVPKGNANVGDPCDQEHCAADLTCLGSPGDRVCYKLCKTEGADCGPMQKCTTGSVFVDTSFGVCKDE